MDRLCSQPHPSPDRAVTAAKPTNETSPTLADSRRYCTKVCPVPQTCRADSAATAMSAKMAVCLKPAAAAIVSDAHTMRPSTASSSPTTTSAIIAASLCAPPTRCMSTSGLSTPSQRAPCSLTPYLAASLGSAIASTATHRIAGKRIATAAT